MSRPVFAIPDPAEICSEWWNDSLSQETMEQHLPEHLETEQIRYLFGIPLFDLEACSVRGILLPRTAELFSTIVKNGDADELVSFAAASLLTGAYLGVFDRGTLSQLPDEFAVDPLSLTDDSLIRKMRRHHSLPIRRSDYPYPAEGVSVGKVSNPAFEPLQIVIEPTAA